MALLDGINVFGVAVKVQGPQINPRRDQRTHYAGLNGVESLDLGDQGATTIVTGRLYGSTPTELMSAILALMSFYDGLPHTFTDSMGAIWGNVKFESLEFPEEKASLTPHLGYNRMYVARFFHLAL